MCILRVFVLCMLLANKRIPATLTYIDRNAPYVKSPALIPYPSWEGNVLGDCASGLSTVYRMKADKCDRLWVLDTGTFGIVNTTNPCPYSLNVYDLKTDRRIRRYVLRPEDINPSTFIANIAIDMGASCEDTFAYMSDELGYGLIAYSWQQNKSWRFTHSFFMPDPLLGDFNISGLNFQWGAEGIFGITLSPIGEDGFRTMYFSPLASNREFSVSTRILRNESRTEDSYHDFNVLESRAPNSHLTSKVMSEDGVMLFNMIDQSAIGCWNSINAYSPKYHALVDKDDVALSFPSDVKIDDENNVWVISDRMHMFLESNLDYTDTNFRIFTIPLNTLIATTVCDQPRLIEPAPTAVAGIYPNTQFEQTSNDIRVSPNYLSSVGQSFPSNRFAFLPPTNPALSIPNSNVAAYKNPYAFIGLPQSANGQKKKYTYVLNSPGYSDVRSWQSADTPWAQNQQKTNYQVY